MSTRLVWGGRYVVFEELASGGMATVYLAGRLGAGEGPRIVAIKKLFERFAKTPAFVSMFLDEAHLAEKIRHPNVVPTREFLRVPGTLGIVMDFILGIALADLLKKSLVGSAAKPPVEVAVAIAAGVLAGLHAAHELAGDDGAPFDVVHRDISPQNIIVGKDGAARIIDFGIAKATDQLHVTEAGLVKGKTAYIAPEQILGKTVDRRTDIYSTGVVLWEALTGRRLFGGPSSAELLAKRFSDTLPSPAPSTVNRDVSPQLDAVVLRALERSPDARFTSADEMAEALIRAVPPAPAAVVASWVQGVAGARLVELAEMHRRAEASLLTELSAQRSVPPASAPSSVPARVPDLDLPPRSSKPPPSVRPRPPQLELMPVAPRSRPPEARTSSVRPPPPRAQSRVAPRSRTKAIVASLGCVAVVGAVAKLAPAALLSLVAGGATGRGLALSAARLEPGLGGMTLFDVNVAIADAPEIRLHAPELDIELDVHGRVTKVVVPGYELRVRGRAGDVAAKVAAWQKRASLPLAIDATAGHLMWQELMPSVAADAVNVHLRVAGHDEPVLHVDTPNLTVRVLGSELGPWRGVLDAAPTLTELVVSLDREAAGAPPTIKLVGRPVVGQTLSIAIPRARPETLGIPAGLLHVLPTATLELSLDGQLSPTETLEAHAVLGLHGLAGAPTDMVVEGSVSGDPAGVLAVQHGKLTVGAVSTAVSGRLHATPLGVHVEVDRPSSRGPSSPWVLDTRDWTGG